MSEPRWVGWIWKGKRWQRVCEADTLGACSRLLGDKARQRGIRDKHTILTGGGAPTVVPQESHPIAQDARKGVKGGPQGVRREMRAGESR
jgi:hypothetical protein